MIRHFLLSLLLLLTCAGAGATKVNRVDEIERQLKSDLASTSSRKDSIRILYDLFDLVPRQEKISYAKKLYNVAKSENNTAVRLDIIRQLSQMTTLMPVSSDSIYAYLNQEIATIPRSKEQEETAVFLRLRQVAEEVQYSDARQIESRITQLLAEEEKAKNLPLNYRVIRLFAIVQYLSNSGIEGSMLGEYVGMLRERTNQADFKLYAINNIILSASANIYSNVGDAKNAVAVDKELLKVIENLEKDYHKKGRQYRDYSPNKYIIYRQMLMNYDALTPKEIEDYYDKIQLYKAMDEDVAKAENNTHLADLAYAMAKKDYATALPILKKQLEVEKQPAKRLRLLHWLQTAAEGIGDKESQIKALQLYNSLLIDRDTSSTSERAMELDIRTRVSELQADKTYLQFENDREEKEAMRRMMTFVCIGWVIFAIILFVLIFYWGRYRAAAFRIGEWVHNLDEECNYLKYQHYSDYHAANFGETSIDLDNRKKVGRRKRDRSILKMLGYILNDICYISSIGKIGRGKFVRPVSVREVVLLEVEKARKNLDSGAALEIDMPEGDIDVRTDKECLEYVVAHIFFAANRVAEGGKIRLDVKENNKNKRVDLIFTNTSVTVPEGNEDVMFDGFMDVDKLADREDSGLFLARMSAFLIDSDLYLDRSYKEGSRYVFSIAKVMGHAED